MKTKSWSFVEMQSFIEEYRPWSKNNRMAYLYTFHCISDKLPHEVLIDFDKWCKRNRTLSIRNRIGAFLIRLGSKL